MKFITRILIFLLLITVAGCTFNVADNPKKNDGNTDTTTVIQSDVGYDEQVKTDLSADRVTVLSETEVETDASVPVAQDEIIIINNRAQKITSVTNQGDTNHLQLSEPEFQEVFKTLEVASSVYITEEHIPELSSRGSTTEDTTNDGIKKYITCEFKNNTLTYKLNDVKIPYLPGLTLKGSVNFEKPKIKFDYNYGIFDREDNYLKFQFTAKQTASISYETDEIKLDKSLSIPLGKVIVPIPITGGVINAEMTISLECSIKGKAQFKHEIKEELLLDMGINTSLAPFKTEVKNNSKFDFTIGKPTLSGELAVCVGISPDVSINIFQYELLGLDNNLGIKSDAKLTVELGGKQEFSVKVYPDFKASVYFLYPTLGSDDLISWNITNLSDLVRMKKHTTDLFTYTDKDEVFYEYIYHTTPTPTAVPVATPVPTAAPVVFKDKNLETWIREETGQAEGPVYPKVIGHMRANDKNISSIEGLQHFAVWGELYLKNNSINDISPLAAKAGLVSVHMSDNNISDLSPAAGWTSLRILNMTNNNISDLSPLKSLEHLEGVHMSGNPIGSLSALNNLKKLKTLSIENTGGTSLSTLNNESVTQIYGANGITSLSSLSGVPNLDFISFTRARSLSISLYGVDTNTTYVLTMHDATVDSVSISNTRLRALGLSGANIASITLKDLPELSFISMNETRVAKMELNNIPINKETYDYFSTAEIDHLIMSNMSYGSSGVYSPDGTENFLVCNAMATIKKVTITDQSKTTYISFANCGLEDIEIEIVPNLTTLSVRNNNLTSLSFLSNLSSLQSLDISYNNISNISALLNMPALKSVTLNGNDLNFEEGTAEYEVKEKLKKKGVSVF